MLFRPVRPILLRSFFCPFWLSAPLVRPHQQSINHQSAGAEQKTPEIQNVRLVAWQIVDKKGQPVEVHEFWETKPQHLMPSNKFDVECEIVGGGMTLLVTISFGPPLTFLLLR